MTTIQIAHDDSEKTITLNGQITVTGELTAFFALSQEELSAFIERQAKWQNTMALLVQSLNKIPLPKRMVQPTERSKPCDYKQFDARHKSARKQQQLAFRRSYTSELQQRRWKRKRHLHALRQSLKLNYTA